MVCGGGGPFMSCISDPFTEVFNMSLYDMLNVLPRFFLWFSQVKHFETVITSNALFCTNHYLTVF